MTSSIVVSFWVVWFRWGPLVEGTVWSPFALSRPQFRASDLVHRGLGKELSHGSTSPTMLTGPYWARSVLAGGATGASFKDKVGLEGLQNIAGGATRYFLRVAWLLLQTLAASHITWVGEGEYAGCHIAALTWLVTSSRSRSLLRRSLTSTLYCIRAAFVEEFAFAEEEWDCWLVSTNTVAVRTEVARIGHRATRDVRRTRAVRALRGALHFRPRRGRRRPEPNASRGDARRSPGVRSIKTTPTRTPVPWAVPSLPVTGGLPRTGAGRVSSVHDQRGEVEAPSATCREAEPLRCETVQVGRHPYLVTWAAVLRSSFHAHKSRDKGV